MHMFMYEAVLNMYLWSGYLNCFSHLLKNNIYIRNDTAVSICVFRTYRYIFTNIYTVHTHTLKSWVTFLSIAYNNIITGTKSNLKWY